MRFSRSRVVPRRAGASAVKAPRIRAASRRAGAADKIHVASWGIYAPDVAVRERRVEVVLVDELGRRTHFGQLVKRRRVGGYLVELADDTRHGMWWILAAREDPPHTVLIGFRRARRADAEHVLSYVTEAELNRGGR